MQHLGVPGAGGAVGQYAVKRQVWLIGSQTVGKGAKGLRHAARINHRQHGQAEAACDVGGGGRAVEQSHHAFDQHDIRRFCRTCQAPGSILLAAHPQVEVFARVAGGCGVDHRVEKVRPAFEDAHALALPRVKPCETGDDAGLALAGGGRGDEQCSGHF